MKGKLLLLRFQKSALLEELYKGVTGKRKGSYVDE
jgi:hypothetical protein